MDIASIRDAIRNRPFEPFALRLADGRKLEVDHPEFIAMSRDLRRVYYFGPDNSMSVLEPLLVVSLDFPNAPAGAAR